MKFEHFIMALMLPAGLLLIAGGAALQHFQGWAMSDARASIDITASPIFQPSEVGPAYRPALETLPSKQGVINPSELSPESSLPTGSHAPTLSLKNPITPSQDLLKPTQPGLLAANPLLDINRTPIVSQYATFELQQERLHFWFPTHLATEQNIKRGIARILLSGQPFNEKDILSVAPLEMRERPVFYRRVLDQQGEPIRYPFAAFKYIDYVMAHDHYTQTSEQGVEITIPLVASNLSAPAQFYEPMVLQFAQDFNISAALVFAVMETESHFDPTAVSRSNALGLMQIKPEAAGRDVYKLVDFRLDAPTRDELFDPQTNIRIGTAYLSLLKYEYFGLIRNQEVQEMIAISSYNGGLSTVWRLFGDTPAQAVDQINRMNPRVVYRKLRYDHPSDETRRYLDKVLQAKQRYQALLGDDARRLASR